MKTIKLHRTQSQTWRLLLDDLVHPLLVGFHTLTQAITKLTTFYDEVGPIDQESLRALDVQLGQEDTVAEIVDNEELRDDTVQARRSLNGLIQLKYGSKQTTQEPVKGVHRFGEMVAISAMLSRKHNPTEKEIIEGIINLNPAVPNIRLTGPQGSGITYGIVMDDVFGTEVWVIGAAYDKREAEDYLNRIKKLHEETVKANEKLTPEEVAQCKANFRKSVDEWLK